MQLSMPCCVSICACFAAVHSLSAVAATPQGRPSSLIYPLLALASAYIFCSPRSCCCSVSTSAALMRRGLQRFSRLSLSCCTTSSTTIAAAHSSTAHAHRTGPVLSTLAACMSQQGMRFGGPFCGTGISPPPPPPPPPRARNLRRNSPRFTRLSRAQRLNPIFRQCCPCSTHWPRFVHARRLHEPAGHEIVCFMCQLMAL